MTDRAYRIEQVCTAVALAGCGFVVAVIIAVRAIGDAIDAAASLPAPQRAPDTVPDWMNKEADL